MDPVSAAATIACHLEIEGRGLAEGELERLLRDIANRAGEAGRDGGKDRGSTRGTGASRTSPCPSRGESCPRTIPAAPTGSPWPTRSPRRGGTHLRAYPLGHEILGRPVRTDRFSFAGKARIIKIAEDANAAVDSLVACRLPTLAVGLEELASMCSAATGLELTAADLSAAGERICYRERILNYGWGLGVEDDSLPRRFFEEAGSPGPGFETPPIDRERFVDARRRVLPGARARRGRRPRGGEGEEPGVEMERLVAKYEKKLVRHGLVEEGDAVIGGLDDDYVWSREDPRRGLMREVFERLNINSLLMGTPAEPYRSMIRSLVADAQESIRPRDTETRTFLHELPVLKGREPAEISRRAGAPSVRAPGVGRDHIVRHGLS